MTFLVPKDFVDIFFKIKRRVYLTVNVCPLSDGRLLLACGWDAFFNRLRHINNRNNVLKKLKKFCPLCCKALPSTTGIHFGYLDKVQEQGVVLLEMKAPFLTNSIADYLFEKVIEKSNGTDGV